MSRSSASRVMFQVVIAASILLMVAGTTSCGLRENVLFIGASTIERWPTYEDFPSRHWIAKGISTETSTQVLARFDRDAINSHSASVHILCGINDMSSPNYDPALLISNWTTMIKKARAAHMRVYIGTLQPWGAGAFADTARNLKVDAINEQLKSLAPSLGATVIDYHAILSASDGSFIAAYTDDGIHPNQAGYDRMTELAQEILHRP